jgi:hypothetical protein
MAEKKNNFDLLQEMINTRNWAAQLNEPNVIIGKSNPVWEKLSDYIETGDLTSCVKTELYLTILDSEIEDTITKLRVITKDILSDS